VRALRCLGNPFRFKSTSYLMSQVLCPNKAFYCFFGNKWLCFRSNDYYLCLTWDQFSLGYHGWEGAARLYQYFCSHILHALWILMVYFWTLSWIEGRQMNWARSCRFSLGFWFPLSISFHSTRSQLSNVVLGFFCNPLVSYVLFHLPRNSFKMRSNGTYLFEPEILMKLTCNRLV